MLTFVEFGGGQSSQVLIRNDGMGWAHKSAQFGMEYGFTEPMTGHLL